MKKICIVVTLWSSINNWVKPFLKEYEKRGIDVSIACNMDSEYEKELKSQFPFVHTYPMPFPRGVNVVDSIKSVRCLIKLFKTKKFDMVQYSTPNASMYAALAAKLTHIPVRLYCQWGMVFVTMTGIKRKIFEKIERFICRVSTHVQPDSKGNLDFCRKNGFYDENKSCVIWNGSAKGLNLDEFDIQKKYDFAKEIKEKYSISNEAKVIGFVGSLGREKGCNELFSAFKELKNEFDNLKLLFVGPIEKEATIEPELLKYFYECDDIIKTDRVNDVVKHIAAMDVFVLPSYREGFGMSVVEASAMEVPVVVTQYPGPSGAMKDGLTGYSIPVKDIKQMVKFIRELLIDTKKAKEFGENGRQFVEEHFEQKTFIEKYMENRMLLISYMKEENKK